MLPNAAITDYYLNLKVTNRGFILWVVKPRNGSTTNIVARSSNSARSLKFMSTSHSDKNDRKHSAIKQVHKNMRKQLKTNESFSL